MQSSRKPRNSLKRAVIDDSDEELTPPPASSPAPSPRKTLEGEPPVKRVRLKKSFSSAHHSHSQDGPDLQGGNGSPGPIATGRGTSSLHSHKQFKTTETSKPALPGNHGANSTPSRNESTDIDIEGTEDSQLPSSPLTPQSQTKEISPAVDYLVQNAERAPPDSQPPKRKLGPIPKKNRGTAVPTTISSVSGTPVASTGPAISNASSQSTGAPKEGSIIAAKSNGASLLSSKPSTKSGINPATNDVDLRDASVYRNLFGTKGSSSVKAGTGPIRPSISLSSHKKKEADRRAELSKLRDEDRARRMQQSFTASHLYEQHSRIVKFEERLKARNSPSLTGPNVLAGAFRNWSRT